jgi:hypothetical protein
MADPTSFFFANAKPGEPLSYEALQTRRKIAEQLMGKRSPFPKTFGEGLTYAGERFADVMDMNRLDQLEAARSGQLATQRAAAAGALGDGPAATSGATTGGVENTAVMPAAPLPPPSQGSRSTLPTPSGTPLEAGKPGSPLENASPSEGGFNYLDAAALGGGFGPRFRTERNAEVASRVGVDKAIQGINPEMQARMMAAYNAMPDDVKKDFVYNEGSRPRAYQQYLYDTRAGRGPVAPPGSSRHETGEAVDVDRSPALDWLKANGAQFGLAGIPGDYPHLQMARGGRQFLDPNNPATLPIPGQSTVPTIPPGNRDGMTAAIVNQSPAGSMVNTPAPLSGGTATPDMLVPGGFTQPGGPVRTAALTPPGVVSDAGAQAALPPQTPDLVPGSGPPITTQTIKPMPIQVAQDSPQTGPVIPQRPANMPPGYEMAKPVPPPVPERQPMGTTERNAILQSMTDDPTVKAYWAPVIANEKAKRDFVDHRNIEAYKTAMAHHTAMLTLWEKEQLEEQGKSLKTTGEALTLSALPEKLKQDAAKRVSENKELDLKNETATRAANFATQMGGLPETAVNSIVKDYIDNRKPAVDVIAKAQPAIREARLALSQGAITGFGADARINWGRLMTLMGHPDQGSDAANSQLFKTVMQPVINAQRTAAAGNANISNADIANAEKAAAADYNLDARTLHRMLNILEENAVEVLKDYKAKSSVLFGTERNPAAAAAFGAPQFDPEMQKLPAPPKGQRVQVWSSKDAKRYPSGTLVTLPDGREGTVP